MALTSKLSAIGDAIRAKTGGTELLTLDAMPGEIEGIQTGGGASNDGGVIDRTATEYSSLTATGAGDYSFYKCSQLRSVNLPKAMFIGKYAFNSCEKLASASFPMVESVGEYSFTACYKLKNASFPKAKSIGKNALQNCWELKTADFGNATSIGNNALMSCFVLTALILRGDAICSLASTSVFSKCYHILGTVDSSYNIQGLKDGYIYVPDELVDSYKAATNWSTYADQIKPLSEYAG